MSAPHAPHNMVPLVKSKELDIHVYARYPALGHMKTYIAEKKQACNQSPQAIFIFGIGIKAYMRFLTSRF